MLQHGFGLGRLAAVLAGVFLEMLAPRTYFSGEHEIGNILGARWDFHMGKLRRRGRFTSPSGRGRGVR